MFSQKCDKYVNLSDLQEILKNLSKLFPDFSLTCKELQCDCTPYGYAFL